MPVPYAFTKQKLKVCLCACPCSYRIWERALEIFDMSLVVDDRLLEFFADGFPLCQPSCPVGDIA